MAAGPAIAAKAMEASRNGSSPTLSQFRESKGGIIRPEDVNAACREGDQAALDIIRDSGQMIGDVLASLVNFFNPSHIFIGGGIANFGNHLLVAIRELCSIVHFHWLPRICPSSFLAWVELWRYEGDFPGVGLSIR
jgi:predicted NBD/HSP70 family sugar kinase